MNALRCSVLLAALALASCESEYVTKEPPVAPVAAVYLPSYMGSWHVVAYMGSPAQPAIAGETQTYSLAPDGRTVNVAIAWDSSMGEAPPAFSWYVDDPNTNTQWRRPHRPLAGPKYVIMGLDPYYRWAVVGNPAHQFGYVLARRPYLSEQDYRDINEVFYRNHYDTGQLVRVSAAGSSWSAK
jgi:apolipoprotein D and lipocalin family protein